MAYRIGFCGPKGVGKSSTAGMIQVGTAGSFKEVHMLEGAYEGMANMLGVPREALERAESKDTPWDFQTAPCPLLAGKTPRNVFDWLGKVMREEFGDEIFVQLWAEHVHRSVCSAAMNTSVRFPYEAKYMHVVVELVRPGVEYDGTKYNTRIPEECIDLQWELPDKIHSTWRDSMVKLSSELFAQMRTHQDEEMKRHAVLRGVDVDKPYYKPGESTWP